ncbi:MAG: hypothetical protein DCC67_09415 [Planctomycetota bacterium]|nr:MAG: hypothetical protein DCC67_09415 [Planctomycetota bacterium]
MTVIENLEIESDRWDSYADLDCFERIRPRHDGQMPVGSYRARHTASRRANRHRRRLADSVPAGRR